MLQDKVALITGSARRIGAELARKLHDEGMRVAIHYRSSRDDAKELLDELNEKRENSAVLLQADLLSTKGITKLIQKLIEQFGQLDVLVNNASSFYPTPIGKTTEKEWDDLIGSNMKAPFFLSQAAAQHLKETQGCIVNMVDIHAERPLKEHTVYCMAKAGLAMLTKSMAKELGPKVRVNGVAPGAILWPENSIDEVTKQRIVSRSFLKRRGSPDDIIETILFLIERAPYITGQIISVDGGRSHHM